ncbi:MAG: vanadium-dependent haloperoxidase [Bacteroidota bacterium]
MIKMKYPISALLLALIISCKSQLPVEAVSNQELPHQLVKKLTDIIVVDIFTPPVASRIYANTSLAMYEALRFENSSAPSITAKLKGFDPMPIPSENISYNFSIAAIQAFCETAKKVTFSAPEITAYQDSMIKQYASNLDQVIVDSSIAFGQRVADVVAKRLGKDNYKETRGMERFEVKTSDQTRWVPTAPDYADGLEPFWSTMLTMGLDSSNQIEADDFPAYSEDKNSAFYKEMKEVYDISKSLTDEQIDIALFWDDNPFVSKHKGHVMFQDKKMTPGGHWMAIAAKACKINNADPVISAKAYAYTAIGLYDGFISCWYVKYKTVRIRPQTAIQRLIDEQWISFIQTPPFPEYTSGHSTTSSSAAEMLTHVFGDNIAFTDSSELEYNLPVRSFKSFRHAAEEASISRVYGSIHYRSGCENGNKQGKQVAAAILAKLQ